MANVNLNDWCKKNLITDTTVPFDKCTVTDRNKDGSLKLICDGKWVNKASIPAIKEAVSSGKLHIVYVENPEWKNGGAWLTAYDAAKREEEKVNV